MGSLTLPCSSVIDWMNHQSTILQQWFTNEPQRIEGFILRKCNAWLEPLEFFPASNTNEASRARFDLMINSKRDLWRIRLELTFHLNNYVTEDGSNVGPGLLFAVFDGDGRPVPVDYLTIGSEALEQPLPAEPFCEFWFNKLFKSARIKRVFAYKEYEAEVE